MNDTGTVLIRGWVSSPDQRGTMDIIWSCIVTVFLCSWSVLFLNVSGKHGSRPYLSTKFSWAAFAIFFPEILATFAQNQWLSARQSIFEFNKLKKPGCPEWTLTHAFFADMGGFMLESPGYPNFPVTAYQVHYLVSEGYMDFPVIDRETVWDKNKADSFVRILTFIQILWFALQCISRAILYSRISTLELDVVAIVLCTFPTFYFWLHKPLDVSTTITLHLRTRTSLEDILRSAGDSAKEPFKFTPLDFVRPAPDPYEILDTIMWGLEDLFGVSGDPDHGLITTFQNTSRTNPSKVGVFDMAVSTIISLTFICIHFIAWHFTFPTSIERDLSRGACLVLLAVGISFGTLSLLINWQLPRICRMSGIEPVTTTTQLYRKMHWAFQHAVTLSHVGLCGGARLCIIGIACAGLRALPANSFQTVECSNFLPHV